jgi:elongation factor 1-beta
MAQVIITLKIMPESVDSPLEEISQKAQSKISAFGGDVGKKEIEPIAFGLKAINLTFVMDEKKGSTESLEQDIAAIEGVASAEVVDVRRAIG